MMNGKLFLGTARLLLRNGSDEAAYRSAVSRAYYACFIATRDLAWNTCRHEYRMKAGKIRADRIGHSDLRNYLNYGSTNTKLLCQDLKSLFGNRSDADYRMDKKMTFDDAKDALEEAEATLEMLCNTPQEDIKNAIEGYLKATNQDIKESLN